MTHYLVTTILLMLAGWVVGTPTPEPDPCDPTVYKELNEPSRSTGFEFVYPAKPKCDIHLQPGWYRFTSQAGGTMPTKCPEMFSCGTIVPIWMKGELPTVGEGAVIRKVCGNFRSGGKQNDPCCDASATIKVKNCGQFYVYLLFPVPSCPVAYCAGEVAPCPVGQWSKTGFPPCRYAFPFLKDAPKLNGPIIHGTSFDFQCEFTYDISDSDQVFEVMWTFDGVQDPNVTTRQLTDPSRIATLDGALLQSHINSTIVCRVRAFYRGNQDVKSDWLISNAYYAGIQVRPATLTVSEKEFSTDVTVTSTIPVVCTHNRGHCCLTFTLDTNAKEEALIPNSCNYNMCNYDWDQKAKMAEIKVPVVANQDLVTDGKKHLLLTFETLTSAGGGPYMDVFDGYQPYQVKVTVEDEETSTCSIFGDPHILSFDNEYYDLFLLGDFTVYEVPERHFQIQIRTWACMKVTCVCGVVIREGNDIIRIDQCDQQYNGPHTSPTIEIGSKPLREGVVIQRSKTGSTIGVYLLSGAQIKVVASGKWFNVDITGPGVDKNKARGICGTYDGNKKNEFTYPDGKVDHAVSNKFLKAWQADLKDSLFEVLPPEVPVSDEFRYCVCEDHNKTVNCTNRASVEQNSVTCPGCFKVDPLPGFGNGFGQWGRQKREAVYGDIDMPDDIYDLTSVQETLYPAELNKQWPNDDGITEAQAREMCSKALKKSQLNGKCGESDSSMVDGFMQGCLGDILYGGTTEFVDGITSAFTSTCQLDLAKDPANYVSSEEGKQIMKPEFLDDICDLECDKHGHCGQKGVCVCDSGWEGYNCHIQSGIGPQVDKIRSGPLCDLAQRPCQRIFLDVSNVDLSDDLICRVQKVDDQGNSIGRPMDTEANFLSGFRIACALPETTVSSQVYKVSASNDGSLFGNQMSVYVFDSACLDCNETECTEKTTACHIDNVCYRDGAKNANNPFLVCDVNNDTTDWTYKSVCNGVQVADIIFVVDASGSIGPPNFAQQLKFLSNLTQNFVLGPDDVRFGAVLFASGAQKLFDLKDHSDHNNLTEAILSTVYTGGITNTAAALNLVADENMLDPASGGRANATKIVIVITDGRSNSRSRTEAAVQRLKDANVQLISIGVGGNTNGDELVLIASKPENVFEVSGFDVLSHIEEQVTKQTCVPV